MILSIDPYQAMRAGSSRAWGMPRARVVAAILVVAAAWLPTTRGQDAALTPEGQLRAGVDAFAQDRPEEAVTLLTQALQTLRERGVDSIELARAYFLLILAQLKTEEWNGLITSADTYLKDFPRADQREQVAFYRGLATLRARSADEAVKALQDFVREFPSSALAQTAILMVSGTLMQEGRDAENVDLLQGVFDRLSGMERSQAAVYLLASRMEEEQFDDAATFFVEYESPAGVDLHLSRFQLLGLGLADRLLEEGRQKDALRVLRHIWPAERVIAGVSEAIAAGEAIPPLSRSATPMELAKRSMTQQHLTQAAAELEQFKQVADYDVAVKLRLAGAFFDLERYPEASMVYEGMLDSHPESPLAEQANYRLILALLRMEAWPDAIAAIVRFEQNFPSSPLLADALYLKGEALMQLKRGQEASDVFLRVATEFPQSNHAERCHFLAAYALMLMDQNEAAIALLDRHSERFPGGTFAEDAMYWRAMAILYSADYPEARKAHAVYLATYPEGKHRIDSTFRRAQALFNQKQFPDAQRELATFIQEHGDHLLVDEARNLSGDALLATGQVDDGLAVYRSVSPYQGRLYDYAQFRIGKVHLALEDKEAAEAHYRKFLDERPGSPRVPEALKELAALYSSRGDAEQAQAIYWDAIERYGPDPDAAAVEDMMLMLPRLSDGNPEALAARLNQLAKSSSPTLAARARWLQARLATPEEPNATTDLLVGIAKVAQPSQLSPIVLADVADALRTSGSLDTAESYYRGILRFHPLSLLKERAWVGLGLTAMKRGDFDVAMDCFHQFQKTTLDPTLQKEVLTAQAEIYAEQGALDRSAAALEELLTLPSVKGRDQVAALYQIGETYARMGDLRKAIAFYQRIFVLHRGWPDYLAKSYWKSGQAFEALGLTAEARKTYEELTSDAELQDTAEYAQARERLEKLGPTSPETRRENSDA